MRICKKKIEQIPGQSAGDMIWGAIFSNLIKKYKHIVPHPGVGRIFQGGGRGGGGFDEQPSQAVRTGYHNFLDFIWRPFLYNFPKLVICPFICAEFGWTFSFMTCHHLEYKELMKKEKKNNFFFYLRQFCTCNKNLQGEDVDPQDSFTLAPEFFFYQDPHYRRSPESRSGSRR